MYYLGGGNKISEQVTLLKVFVASPEDVKGERKSVTKIVDELNDIRVKDNILLKVVKWETDVSPGVDEYPQEVINKQIGDDYDIFIGIMWKQFGTPTGRAGSGTEEEFDRAYERYQKDPNNIQIMVYFNQTSPTNLDDIDIEQLNLVREFKSNLGVEGVLYWHYDGIDSFERFLRMHLIKKIQQWGKSWGTNSIKAKIKESIQEMDEKESIINFDDNEEYGLIDLIEIGNDNFETSVQSLNRISDAIIAVGDNIEVKGEEFKQSQTPTPNMKQGQRILKSISNEMEEFVERIKPELPIFSDNFSMGIDTLTHAAALTNDFQIETEDPILNAIKTVQEIRESILPALRSVQGLRDTTNNLPRISRDINMAKKHMVTILDELIKEINSAKDLTSEAEKTLEKAWLDPQKQNI